MYDRKDIVYICVIVVIILPTSALSPLIQPSDICVVIVTVVVVVVIVVVVVVIDTQNSKSVIYPNPDASHPIEVDTPNILECNADRTFWMSWARGELQVGRGSVVHSQVFLAWTGPGPHPVSSVGFLRYDKGATVWTLNELDGT